VFPKFPRGWYLACASRELRPGPIGHRLGEQRFAVFRDESGKAVVLDGRCSHMRADLSKGCVRDGMIHCPLHDWRYAGDGRCVRIPASDTIPPFARQIAYPTAEIGGQVVFFNAPIADFPMPFFDGRSPDELCPAEPFDTELECPWYLVGANGFDVQHFRVAHDRTLIDTPSVDRPHPFAQRMTANYDVSGGGMRDGLIRKFAGPRVQMSVTSWAGVNIIVTATFQRARTHGMVFVRPLSENRTLLKTIVWVPRRSAWIDPLRAAIRRRFIHAFLQDDASRSDGARYNPATLVDADREMKRYLEWLASLSSNRSVDVSVAPHITSAAAEVAQEGAV
jgi:phenylpropionate dioxygenase-like ring-hydroxylating dioxygenase large terminal subunit